MIRALRGASLFWRLSLVLFAALLLLHLGAFYFYGHERMLKTAQTFAEGVVERTVSLDPLLARQPELLKHFDSPTFRLRYVAAAPTLERRIWPHNEDMRAVVTARLIALGVPDPERVAVAFTRGRRSEPPAFHFAMPSARGGYLYAEAFTSIPGQGYGSPAGWMTSFLFLLLLVVLIWASRRGTRQLEALVHGAQALGHGDEGEPLPEDVGPRELRAASVAFNSMRARVLGLLAERTDMLAGISHDLRTLCTRLALRMEHIPEPEQRAKAEAEMATMTGVLNQALAYAKDQNSSEALQPVDVNSLLEKLAQDHGDSVAIESGARVVIRAQPLALRRLCENLVDNAVKYGRRAVLSLDAGALRVRDAGPGMSPAEVSQALKPYRRLEAARSQNLPGTGLGLSIVANICRRHGWRLDFGHTDDGFEARVLWG